MRKLKKQRLPTQKVLALMKYTPPQRKAENLFDEFVMLLARRCQEKTTMAGAVKWTCFPVEYALASGFWPILILIAKELKVSLATPTEVTFVATKVNQLIWVAIETVYPDLGQMVNEFETKVINLLERAVALGYRPGMNFSLATWRQLRDGDEISFEQGVSRWEKPAGSVDAHLLFQAPVALFFLDMIKKTRQRYEVWYQEYKKLATANIFDIESECAWSEEGVGLQRVKQVLELFDVTLDARARSYKGTDLEVMNSNVGMIVNLDDMLKTLKGHVLLARQLPVNVAELKTHLGCDLGFSSGIDLDWVNAQLLITAGNLPEGEWIRLKDFSSALEALKKMSIPDLVEQTLQRWQKNRKFGPPSKVEQLIRGLLTRRAKMMLSWTAKKVRGQAVPDSAYVLHLLSEK